MDLSEGIPLEKGLLQFLQLPADPFAGGAEDGLGRDPLGEHFRETTRLIHQAGGNETFQDLREGLRRPGAELGVRVGRFFSEPLEDFLCCLSVTDAVELHNDSWQLLLEIGVERTGLVSPLNPLELLLQTTETALALFLLLRLPGLPFTL